ncbi:MAG: hypothetical protein K0Q78_1730 [Cellvibrio sp.]|jgi:quinol monooxygenase YgiN|nr:hypothetical protein [Cellvibrio sp.]
MSISLVIGFTVKNDRLTSFKKIMTDVKINLPKVKGCKKVTIFNREENPLEFKLVEKWDSKALHESHVEGLIASGQWNLLVEHLQEPPVSGYYSEI